MNSEEILSQTESSIEGINASEISTRQEKYGKNVLESKKKNPLILIFLHQFKDLLVLILGIAILISAFSGEMASAIVIAVVIVLNAIVGTVQTVKSEKAVSDLKSIAALKARVVRGGVKQEIDGAEIVVGDIIVLEAGDVVPADGRIIEAYSLQVVESALTGEATSTDKSSDVLTDESTPLSERTNMVYSGSLVTYGKAVVVTVAVGMDTEIGKIAELINKEKDKKTPLELDLEKFNKRLTIYVTILCLALFGFNLFQGVDVTTALMLAVSLAVAAVPEVLAIVVTITLAIGARNMAKENAVIKKIKSVETIGALSIICSDKTGTLTQNKMTVTHIYRDFKLINNTELDKNNELDNLILNCAALCNNARIDGDSQIGDPTELALTALSINYDLNPDELLRALPRLYELPFDSDRKMMSVINKMDNDNGNVAFTKGAPDAILQRCKNIVVLNEKRALLPDDLEAIVKQNEAFAKEGLRVLALAIKQGAGEDFEEADLTFLGLLSLQDPPREESRDAVREAIGAGIKPIMITGDHKLTAKSIASQVGIFKEGDQALDGNELDAMSENEFMEKLPDVSVYARVTPAHKIQIVKAWQSLGHTVAMTGDGVNDAPALKSADVGIAMGITGTEVSKDAASMVLMDDNFATIIKAISNGRSLFENIKNSIIYLLATNSATIICILLTTFMFLPTPFLPVHLLFINLATDSLPAIAIGMEAVRPELMKHAPRDKSKFIIDKFVIKKVIGEALLLSGATLAAYYIGIQTSPELAKTFAFFTMCLTRLIYGFNARSNMPISKLGLFTNKVSVYALLAGVFLLHLLIFIPSLRNLFETSALNMGELGTIYALSILPTIIIQIFKHIKNSKMVA